MCYPQINLLGFWRLLQVESSLRPNCVISFYLHLFPCWKGKKKKKKAHLKKVPDSSHFLPMHEVLWPLIGYNKIWGRSWVSRGLDVAVSFSPTRLGSWFIFGQLPTSSYTMRSLSWNLRLIKIKIHRFRQWGYLKWSRNKHFKEIVCVNILDKFIL